MVELELRRPVAREPVDDLLDDARDRVELDAGHGPHGADAEGVAGDQGVDPEPGGQRDLVLADQPPVQPAGLALAEDAGRDLHGGQLAGPGHVGGQPAGEPHRRRRHVLGQRPTSAGDGDRRQGVGQLALGRVSGRDVAEVVLGPGERLAPR